MSYSNSYNNKKKELEGKVIRVTKNFGFVSIKNKNGEEKEYFVPGRGLMGALVGDTVALVEKKSLGSSPEGIITRIIKQGESTLIGKIEFTDQGFVLVPDDLEIPIHLQKDAIAGAKPGDKVLVKITKRAKNHFNLRGEVVVNFGNSDKATASEMAILTEHKVETTFSEEVKNEASKIAKYKISDSDFENRLDLRDRLIFTIDSSETKDIDDAVSIEKTDFGYELGVHIADVSYFVKSGSYIDNEAKNRGNSLYFANKVVPMLPKELSNGICSLNPNEDRLAFSVFMRIDENGNLKDFKFKKTIINSKIQGVYSEINKIIDGTASSTILKKYSEAIDSIKLMEELTKKRIALESARGGFELYKPEAKLVFDEKDRLIGIDLHDRGFSERMIEQFMLLANESAATFARQKNIPFLYRVHEEPSESKIADFVSVLNALSIRHPKIESKLTQKDIKKVLANAKGTPYFEVINYRVLRTMAKARYDENPIGHYGLVLDNYTHFTSPIRRYSDLTIHRIMSDVLSGKASGSSWEKKTKKTVSYVAKQTSAREIESLTIERGVEDCYKAEYMAKFIGKTFEAQITGFNTGGMFIELKNTVDGFVPFSSYRDGRFDISNGVSAKSASQTFNLGDILSVVLVKAEVSTGKVDFVTEENYESYQRHMQNYDRPAKSPNRNDRRKDEKKPKGAFSKNKKQGQQSKNGKKPGAKAKPKQFRNAPKKKNVGINKKRDGR